MLKHSPFATVAVAIAFAGIASALSSTALAAGPQYMVIGQAASSLLDKKAAEAVVLGALPAGKLAKIYPPSKWGFAAQVEGGLTSAGVCSVSARVTLLSRTVAQQSLLMRPSARTSATFDAQPGLTQDKCSALAATKLKEATVSVLSGLMK